MGQLLVYHQLLHHMIKTSIPADRQVMLELLVRELIIRLLCSPITVAIYQKHQEH